MKPKEQRGFVLFVVMIFLIVMSMLGISMFGGFIKDQKISGNMREKQRAIEAAQSGLDSVQAWLQLPDKVYEGSWSVGVVCDSSTQYGTTPIVCSNALPSPATLPWSSSQTFQPPNMTVVASGGANSYASNVGYYVQYLGQTPKNPPAALYKVTATAQGGNATAAAVVETIFEVTVTARDIGGG